MPSNQLKNLTSVKLSTPIKINLALHITGQRDDGYHQLESLVIFADDGDIVHAKLSAKDQFSITGRYKAHLSTGSDNLVLQARDQLRAYVAQDCPAAAISLEKRLPLASGLGGGSGDAAATLIALNKIWQLKLKTRELFALGARLGADVPACLHYLINQQPLLISGIGTTMKTIDSFPALSLVLVNDGTKVATANVFAALPCKTNAPLQQKNLNFCHPPLIDYLKTTRNDLFLPARAIAPTIQTQIDALTKKGAQFVRMSGSGATCFGIFKNDNAAQDAAQSLQNCYPEWYIQPIKTLGTCHEYD